MQLKQYKEIQEKESQLQADMRNFILHAIEQNGGRITYIPPSDSKEDEDCISYDDKYPIISTFFGKHDRHYNIAITDIYTHTDTIDNTYIYIDGVDTDNDDKIIGAHLGFSIYPDQYYEMINFIMSALNKQIRQFAERLALNDLVDKYSKMPCEFYTEARTIKDQYHTENWDNTLKYIQQIEELHIKCSEPDSDKHDLNSDIMSYVCDLANLALIEQNNLLMDDMTIEEDNSIRFTEEKQDEFNALYDEIEGRFWELLKFEGIN